MTEIEMPELTRFQTLRKKIIDVMIHLLGKQFATTTGMIKNLIQVQDSYINSYHPDFMGGANSIVNVFDVNSYQKHMQDANKRGGLN